MTVALNVLASYINIFLFNTFQHRYYLLILDACIAPDELINPKKKIFEQIQVIPSFVW